MLGSVGQTQSEESRFVENSPPLSLRGDSLGLVLADVLASGRRFRFTARGYSMMPFIRDGDELTVEPLNSAAPLLGNVVACRDPSSTAGVFLHRVVRISNGRYTLQGDACIDVDGEFDRSQVVGRVRGIARDGQKKTMGLGASGPLIAFAKRHPRPGRFILRFLHFIARRNV